MKNLLLNFWNDEDGATAIEYGLIAGLVAIGIITALGALGTNLSGMFDFIADKLPQDAGGE